MRKDVHGALPENVQIRIFYTGTKSCTKFNYIKNPVKKFQQHNVVCYLTCPKPSFVKDYTGETGRRLNERMNEHNGRNKKSSFYKHYQESDNPCVTLRDFKIIGSNFQNQKYKRKIAELLLIRNKHSSLNTGDVGSTKTFHLNAI